MIGYWKELFDHVYKNRNRHVYRRQLENQAATWKDSKWLRRWWNTASFSDLRRYWPLRIDSQSNEGKYLFWSWVTVGLHTALLLVALGFITESALWTIHFELPIDYMLMQQRFRLIDLKKNYQLPEFLAKWLPDEPLPEMVEIPVSNGTFILGEQDTTFINDYKKGGTKSEYHHPWDWGTPGIKKEEAIPKPYALGKFEVSFRQFDYFVWDQLKNSNLRNDKGEIALKDESSDETVLVKLKYPTTGKAGRDQHPVVSVNLTEINAYLNWLATKFNNKKTYRLPTEVEWEFAARGGMEGIRRIKPEYYTNYPWGNEDPDIKQVANLLKYIASDNITPEQRQKLCDTISIIFGKIISLTPDNIGSVEIPNLLTSTIASQYPKSSNKLGEFLKEVENKMKDNNLLEITRQYPSYLYYFIYVINEVKTIINDSYPLKNYKNHIIYANCKDCDEQINEHSLTEDESLQYVKPIKIGEKELYNMAGNVWEITCSQWREDFDAGKVNGVEGFEAEKNCLPDITKGTPDTRHLRVMRGGAFDFPKKSVRTATRYRFNVHFPYDDGGFRVARID